jgi:hypothetical protein
MRASPLNFTLPGYLLPDAASQARIETVRRRLKAVASS